jgi:hypothetical protein
MPRTRRPFSVWRGEYYLGEEFFMNKKFLFIGMAAILDTYTAGLDRGKETEDTPEFGDKRPYGVFFRPRLRRPHALLE